MHVHDFTAVFGFMFLLFGSVDVGAELTTTSTLQLQILNGSSVTLKCRTTNHNEKVRWQFKGPSRENPERIHNGMQLLGHFRKSCSETFDVNSRESMLTIKHVDRIDAGIYTCMETNSSDYRIDFERTVIFNEQDAWTTAPTTSSVSRESPTSAAKLPVSGRLHTTPAMQPASGHTVTAAGATPGDPVEIVLTVSLIITAAITTFVFAFILIIRRKKVDVSRGRRPTALHTPVVPAAGRVDQHVENVGNPATLRGSGGTLIVPPRAPAYRPNDEFHINAAEPGTVSRGRPGHIEDEEDRIDPMYAQVAGRRNQQQATGRAQSRTNATRFV